MLTSYTMSLQVAAIEYWNIDLLNVTGGIFWHILTIDSWIFHSRIYFLLLLFGQQQWVTTRGQLLHIAPLNISNLHSLIHVQFSSNVDIHIWAVDLRSWLIMLINSATQCRWPWTAYQYSELNEVHPCLCHANVLAAKISLLLLFSQKRLL